MEKLCKLLGGPNPDELRLHLVFHIVGEHSLSFWGASADPSVQPGKDGAQSWMSLPELGEVFQIRACTPWGMDHFLLVSVLYRALNEGVC